MNSRIAFFEATEEDREWLSDAFPRMQVIAVSEPLNMETVSAAEDADIVSVFVRSKIDKNILSAMPRLSFITTRSMGFDHIDLESCAQRGITISNVPAYGEHTVAEHTFALILALSRKIFTAYERTARMNFDRNGLQGFNLFGKVMGVVGTGAIGRQVIRVARGFHMKTVAFDVSPNEQMSAELGFTYAPTLGSLFGQSDIISLHVPLLEETRHMMNAEAFAQCKRGALLINTARGGLIETEALLTALQDGTISGAGLDVLEGENETFEDIALLSKGIPDNTDTAAIVRNHVLIARDDVLVTPHNAFNSKEAVREIFDVTVNNIKRYHKGRPINIVATAKI